MGNGYFNGRWDKDVEKSFSSPPEKEYKTTDLRGSIVWPMDSMNGAESGCSIGSLFYVQC
jgi:hypothetical protein